MYSFWYVVLSSGFLNGTKLLDLNMLDLYGFKSFGIQQNLIGVKDDISLIDEY
jgi:hypothetical protein